MDTLAPTPRDREPITHTRTIWSWAGCAVGGVLSIEKEKATALAELFRVVGHVQVQIPVVAPVVDHQSRPAAQVHPVFPGMVKEIKSFSLEAV